MVWLLFTLLLLIAGTSAMTRRRNYRAVEIEEEPWRASLPEDEPLDFDAAREAEDDWLSEGWEDADEEDADEEPWRR